MNTVMGINQNLSRAIIIDIYIAILDFFIHSIGFKNRIS